MILGSNRNNIALLSIFFASASIIGMFYFEFTIVNILILLCSFYVLNILGNWMTLHRYYSHRSFEFKNTFLKTFFTIVALLSGRGSTLGWTYIHRIHHAYSDTDNDPHSPASIGFKLFGFGHFKKLEEENFKIFLVQDLMTRDHVFYHKYYFLLIFSFIIGLGFINIDLLYFGYLVPCFLVQMSQNIFIYYGHINGYRNYQTKDNSKNNPYLFPLILGECWHNNHHHNPKYYSTKVLQKELDPLNYIIQLVGNVKK